MRRKGGGDREFPFIRVVVVLVRIGVMRYGVIYDAHPPYIFREGVERGKPLLTGKL